MYCGGGYMKAIRQDQKTCYDCKHKIVITEKDGYILGGDNSVEYECINSRVKYGFLKRSNFDYENMAKTCKYFEPQPYKFHCSVCGGKFVFKQPKWQHWINENGEERPVCSEKCAKKRCTA